MSIVECLVTLALFSSLAMLATPAADRIRRRRELLREAERVRQFLVVAQSRADALMHNCGVQFVRHGNVWTCAIYRDGDGDGVMREDIADGTDVRVAGPYQLLDPDSTISVGIPEGFTDPDTLEVIPAGTSPVAFNHSFICSFSPRGSGTPGSVYLTDGMELGAAVRCSGSEGYLRKFYYAGKGRAWKEY